MTEPWLLGSIEGEDPVISHLLRSSQHVRQDVHHWFGAISDEELWKTDTGFHLKHLAGSTSRLCSYLAGAALDPQQITALAEEYKPAPGLLRDIDAALANYEGLLKALSPDNFAADRYIGRKRLKVSAISLAIHIAEHAQRHTGQAIQAFPHARPDKIQ